MTDGNIDNKESKINKLSGAVSSKNISKRYKKVENATLRHANRFVVSRINNFKDARRHISLWVLFVGIIIATAAVQFVWYQQGYRTTAPATGGTYAEAVQGPLDTLNPLFARTAAEESASKLIFSRLLRFDSEGKINYDLAENFSVSKDGKKYTVAIRPDARWHDGLYIRAKDVIFTVNLIKNEQVRSTISGWNGVRVSEIDSKTVAFELPSVYAAFPQALEQLPILPEHILRDVEPAQLRESVFSTKPIGSGPFAVRAVQDADDGSRKVAHLVRNEDYYRGRVNLDRFQLHVYNDIDSLKRAIKGGEVNSASGFTVTDLQDFSSSRYLIESRTINNGVYAILNTASASMSDIKVRRALQSGTDFAKVRQALADDVKPLHLPFVSNQLSGKIPAEPKLDVNFANSQLNSAGWVMKDGRREKNGEPLQISVVTTKSNDLEKILNELVSQWRELGITVTTSIVDPSDPSQNVAQEIFQPRKYDVLLYSLTIGGDPDVYAYWHSSQASNGYNFANYRNAVSDEALLTARTRTESDLRNAKYLTFANQWLKDVPALGIYQATTQYVHTKGVKTTDSDINLVSSVDRYDDVMNWSVGDRGVFKTP